MISTCIILIAFGQQSAATERQIPISEMDILTQQLILRGEDPTAPATLPELGYVGLWRTIYGNKNERSEDGESGEFGVGIEATHLEANTKQTRAAQKLRRAKAAKRVREQQPLNDAPLFADTVSHSTGGIDSTESTSAAGGWGRVTGRSRAAGVGLGDSSGYVPSGARFGTDERSPKLDANTTSTLAMLGCAIVATILLFIVVCLPR